MEDERIAKTILSALLNKNIKEVSVRPHEYSNQTRDSISMFRLDFTATIKEKDGSEYHILIELQKTWLETETLRFRQYLGAQYSDKRNMQRGDRKQYSLPMVAIYILGHRLGDIDEPLIYVSHNVCDRAGNKIEKGIPDPFIDSLQHDSIIVQIPLLHGQLNSHLDRVLSVFDQSNADIDNRHLLALDENAYTQDDGMGYILHRLTLAAADADMRQDMNAEDEFFSAIEDRDTAIMTRDKKIKQQDKKLAEQSNQIAEQSNQIAEQSNQIAEQSNQIAEQSNQIAEQSNQIAEQNNQIAEQNNQIAEQSNQIAEQSNQIAEQNSQLAEQSSQLAEQSSQLAEKDSLLSEQKKRMYSLVAALKDSGMSIAQISKTTGISADELNDLIKNGK